MWRYRRLLLGTAWLELKGNYAGSALGFLWVVLSPIIMIAIYSSVYTFIFRVSLPNMTTFDYVMRVAAGLFTFTAFGGALAQGATAMLKNRNIVMNAVFPAELLPVRAVLIAFPPLAVGLPLLIVVSLIFGKGGWALLLLPVLFVLLFMLMTGIAWVLSLLTLILRDLQHAIQFVVMVLLIVTPIGYTVSMVPPKLLLLVRLNPLAYFVFAFQDIVSLGQVPQIKGLIVIFVMSLLSFWLGFWVFEKVKRAFYDYA
jgi:lipopolysaccharide transport system permease protein